MGILGINLEGIISTLFTILIAGGFAYAIFSVVMGVIQLMNAITPDAKKRAIMKLVLSGAGIIILTILAFSVGRIVDLIF